MKSESGWRLPGNLKTPGIKETIYFIPFIPGNIYAGKILLHFNRLKTKDIGQSLRIGNRYRDGI
jgi:hypothetical protein